MIEVEVYLCAYLGRLSAGDRVAVFPTLAGGGRI